METTAVKPQFSEAAQAEIKRLLTHYPDDRRKSALLPVLHIAQAEFGGWVSPEVQDLVAEVLDIKPIEVYEVATFYTMFNLKPVGKHVLEICRTGPCMLRGSDELTAHLERITGAKVGGPASADGLFTLKEVECLAACGFAPIVQVREKYYEQLDTPEAVDAMLTELRNQVHRPALPWEETGLPNALANN
ncbi:MULTISPECIES: NAD(P)H-dependent oxidoreductase subunit E [Hymenobacter]|uniref:NADH-quinone oxidoreductase subunit NuoE family protein n=1 Tax=Hymenobacter TaxID=89966 RepID=UPI000DA64FFC|nr:MULTISPECIES: NAD(P)H-dependent oxidoreductase subunit E [Hymenobacter]MBX0292415.1 NAD(P)H-dependent oxidoreductase subunit E [Hymenobacter sp. HSC-4F20]RPD47159.1 NAD(P)H-dependent oxidoreductase subunit E [Hymenobacter sediminis]